MNVALQTTFTNFSRNHQIRRLRAAALAGLAHFEVPAGRLRLAQYELNAVYRLATDSDPYFLRVSTRPDRSLASIRAEMQWLEALDRAPAVHSPKPVHNRSGGYPVRLDPPALGFDVVIAMTGWIDGTVPWFDYTTGQAEAFGRMTGAMHAAAASFSPPADFDRPVWSFESIAAELSGNLAEVARAIGPDAPTTLSEARRRIADGPAGEDATSTLIHGDLHRGNFLITPSDGLAIIDFEDCGWGHALLDVATFLGSVVRLDPADRAGYRDFARRYLDGYATSRPQPVDLDSFNDYLALRDLVITNYLARSTNPTVARWRIERLTEVVGQLAEYVATGNYLGSLR